MNTPCETTGRRGERTARVHTDYLRTLWERHHGTKVPKGAVLMHLCDEPRCSNVAEHVVVGSYSDNMKDASGKGRVRGVVHGAGEAHRHAKITDADVRAIRRLQSEGMTQKALAAVYGIDQSEVSRIVTRRLWAHVK